MTSFEAFTLVLSALAIIIAAIALFNSWRTNQKQIELQRNTDELAKKQLQHLAATEQYASSADLRVSLQPHGQRSHHIVIHNAGYSEARDVSLTVQPRGDGTNPVVQNDYKSKFPVSILSPSGEVRVLTVFSKDSSSALDLVISWTNPDGQQVSRKDYIGL